MDGAGHSHVWPCLADRAIILSTGGGGSCIYAILPYYCSTSALVVFSRVL